MPSRPCFPWLCRTALAIVLLITLQPLPAAASSQTAASSATSFTSVQLDSAAHPQSALFAPTAQAQDLTEYALQPVASSAQIDPQTAQSYSAANPAQGLHILFGPDDLTIAAAASGDLPWNVGLQLTGYARGSSGTPVAAAATSVEANHIQYARDSIVEWYVNTPDGLKQGFTLQAPPAASGAAGQVRLQIEVEGTLTPQMSIDGRAVDFVTAQHAPLLRYAGLIVYDANRTVLPAQLSVNGSAVVISIDDEHAAYPVTVDPLLTSPLKKQSATDGAAGDFLGYDVNVSQGLAIVGAYGDDNENGADAGTVYLFAQNEDGANQWGQRARLVASDGQPGDQFGKDVYVTFGITVAVGAPGDDDLGTNAGAAYLFAHNQGGPDAWGELTKLTPSNGAAGDAFGSAVSTQESTAIVGAPGQDMMGTDAGAVYVFEPASPFSPTVWVQTKVITAPDGAAGDAFGTAVVNSEDLLIVGAPGDDDACPSDTDCDSGAIYIFERNLGGPNQWGLLHKRTAPDASASARFGTSLNISTERVIVGAPGDDEKGEDAGAAYIFDRSLGGTDMWGARPKLTAPDAAAGDQFGRSVGIGGNIAMVGAPFDDDSGTDSGAAYLVLFRGFAGQGPWGRTVKLLANDGAGGDHFGASVDQRSGHIVIGSPSAKTGAAATGAAYFYATPFVMGTLQYGSNVEPNDASTNWEYVVDGPLSDAQNLTGDTQTQPALVYPGTYTITETAGLNTDGTLYDTTWHCAVNGASGPSGSGTTLKVFIDALDSVACTFTHVRPGTIVIEKVSEPAGGTDFAFTDDIAPPHNFTLDDAGTKTFTDIEPGTYRVTETVAADWRLTSIQCVDSDGGSTGADTHALINIDAGESVTCTFSNRAKAGIAVIKSADVSLATVGQVITYTYTVINDSIDALSDVVAIDDKLGPITLEKTTLAPGEQTTGTQQYTVTDADLPGPLQNTVVVSGTPPASSVVSDSTSLSINLVGSASIDVEVTAAPLEAEVEDVIEYTYRVTNTGLAPVTDVVVMDARLGSVPLTDDSLQPDESASGTLLYTVLVEDLPGPLVNNVTVTGQPPAGDPVTDSDAVTVTLVAEAGIMGMVTPNVTTAHVGDTITYTYAITNSGMITLENISASDSRVGEIVFPTTTLGPDESASAIGTYTVLASDLPGPLANTFTVTGTPPVGDAVEHQATASVTLEEEEEEPSRSASYLPQIYR